MDSLRRFMGDRRVVMAGGMALALLAGLAVATLLMFRSGTPTQEASTGELVVQTGRPDDVKMDPQRPLRCFVGGKSIGEMPLRDCAEKNGVATGALDVGLDQTGTLAATPGATSDITPLPPPDAAASDTAAAPTGDLTPDQPPAPVRTWTASAAPAGCWRYGDGGWSRLPDDMPLPACVEALYAGQCEPAGEVAYGRWGGRTLRLTGGAVQASDDNRTFRVLVTQGPGCSIPPPGH